GALRRPGGDPTAIDEACVLVVRGLARRAEAAGLAPFSVAAGQTWPVAADGGGDAPLLVAPSSFELFRASLGRRSRHQVESWRWVADGVDAGPYLDLLFTFGPRDDPLLEEGPADG
ncbi:MAG TPA: hypothetical protein VMY78_07460, partial [Solirubrobacteraceae bacterium]|nr:hypothetical protein [Solirubrobacteraceae bacterium]